MHAYSIKNLEYICNLNKHQADFSTTDMNEILNSEESVVHLQKVLNRHSDVYRILLRITVTFKIAFQEKT